MKAFIFALSMIFLFSCSGKKGVVKKEVPAADKGTVTKEKPVNSQAIEEFLVKFEQVALAHDRTAMLELMDKEYKVLKLDKASDGDKEKLIDDFFCNYQTNGQGLKCIKFNEITEVKRIEVMSNDLNYTVVYHITGNGATIKCDYLVIARKEAGKTVYGFYGS